MLSRNSSSFVFPLYGALLRAATCKLDTFLQTGAVSSGHFVSRTSRTFAAQAVPLTNDTHSLGVPDAEVAGVGAAHVAPEQPLAAKAAELLDYVTRQPPSRRVLGPEASATAYAGHSTTELLRSVAVLKACQVKPLVRNAEALIRLAESTVGPRITHAAIGATFYPQFAAGVDLEAVRCSAADLSARGVHAVLDYSAESDLEHATDDPSAIDRQCELNLRRTIESVRAAAAVTPAGAAPMIACKVTAFASVAVLEKVSQLLDQGLMQPGDLEDVEAAAPRLPLTPDEAASLTALVGRMDLLMREATALGVQVYVDAEQSYFQGAIDALAMEMMRRHNMDGSTTCATTYQCYRCDAVDRMLAHMELAKQGGFAFAAKAVRGAYMHLERSLAAASGRPDPINPDIESTARCYDTAVAAALTEIAAGKDVQIMVATHNGQSVERAALMMDTLGLSKEASDRVHFAQLLGMADYITFPLASAGYQTRKFTPYGPVGEVIPYLLRRARENSDALGAVQYDIAALGKELARRFAGQR